MSTTPARSSKPLRSSSGTSDPEYNRTPLILSKKPLSIPPEPVFPLESFFLPDLTLDSYRHVYKTTQHFESVYKSQILLNPNEMNVLRLYESLWRGYQGFLQAKEVEIIEFAIGKMV